MSRSTTLLRSLALVGALGLTGTGLVACGSSSTTASDTAASTPTATVSSETTATSGTTSQVAGTVAVTLGSPEAFSLVPSPTSAKAGEVTFNVDNAGSMTHELVVMKTDTKAADLPTKDGEAVESNVIGETGDMAAGTKKTLTVTLQKGHYVLLCNLPGHYAGGMYKDFTVS